MNETIEILDCGHAPNPDANTSGYGQDSEGKKYCYACCAERDKEAMRTDGRITLYLSKVGAHDKSQRAFIAQHYKISNWPGTLTIEPTKVEIGRHNIAGTRYNVWFVFEGDWWYGVQYGENTQLLHCKRTKEKVNPPQYKMVRYELWGNARDGFDTNNFYNAGTLRADAGKRTLLSAVRDAFSGYSFAWSESVSRPMVRDAIKLNDLCNGVILVEYHGHAVGEVQYEA